MRILVTGCCGFIGYHLCKKLIMNNHYLIGIDNFNDYYDPKIKYDRYNNLKEDMQVIKGNIEDKNVYKQISKVGLVIHLAAQAGVRYSLINPESYVNTNILGFFNLLEFSKQCNCSKIIYASSASVYGKNPIPWKEDMNLSNPISLYGATKISSEVLADSYFEMFGLKSIGLRFFSVYGPFGRPDLSLWKWTDCILNNNPVQLYNYGKHNRSWTYIDDIIDGIMKTIDFECNNEKFNLGNEELINIEDTVDYIAKFLQMKPKKEYKPKQPGDIIDAQPDLTKSKTLLNFNPKVEFKDGIEKFIDWFKQYKKNEQKTTLVCK